MTTDAARDARAAFELGEQLNLALERIAELGRQLERAHADAADRDVALSALQESWRTIDGRTLRHEAGLDTVRELRALVEHLGERVEQESALRREAVAALTQELGQDGKAAAASRAAGIAARLETVEELARQSEAERRHLGAGLGLIKVFAQEGTKRLDELDLRLSSSREAERATADGLTVVEGRVVALAVALNDLDTRAREAQAAGRVLSESVGTLQTTRAREAEPLDLIEQQRAMRQRLEQRLMALEEGMTATGRALLEAAEQRAQLRLQFAGVERRLTALAERFTEQRELVQRQWRAILDADDVAEARVVSDLERRARERRELLRRLSEESEQALQGGAQ
ncbi:MAG: hypothetical protein EXR66_06705 [Dehalococcoidia bacterium]|nr:hypothetical protein [Dehalococcoidia bacterium]